ncbi:hypothetical protein P3T36_007596 [Kitasatospora sp. MAP12-15]|uniref:hypothetical protein n=1 Tax=unclassified Kitasatospora TaxID=2633591 RepID=UPI0024762F6D|nr:hypothetical protein [Kitasatospora sp. MAP12-44]MDH6108100.1 hypothetical protein [Kitasatospora sp. MAP12-44]
MSSTLVGPQSGTNLNTVFCPAGKFATGGGAYNLNPLTGLHFAIQGAVYPIGSPPTGFQAEIGGGVGVGVNTVVYAICRA